MHNDDAGLEVFFDLDDNTRTSVDSTSSYFSVDEGHELNLRILNAESWMGDMLSVQERRQKFFSTMDFGDFFVSQSGVSGHLESSRDGLPMCIEPRLTESNGSSLDSFSESNDGRHEDSLYCIRNLDNGKVFTVHEHGDDGLPSMLKELGSDKILTYMEFEKLLGLHSSVHEPMNRKNSPSAEKKCEAFARRKHRSWWRRFINRRHVVVMYKHDASVKHSQLSRTMRTNVLRHRKRCIELTGLFVEQEIRAHNGSVRTMKFSSSGWYLASGGEDCVVRIWQIKEAEASCKCIVENSSANCFGKSKCSSLIGVKGNSCTSIVFPKKAFKILEKPLHEFCGHTGDILDVSWSVSDFLLTSSMDKTVRLWKTGCDGCLRIFRHNDYVTCIQFNPVDERYFISGSIDGKVRIWGVSKNHVVDWADICDIVTAVCYRPDGKGFVVGSINGNCRFFEYLGNSLQSYMQFSIEGKQKSTRKRVTGLQFSPDDAQQILITSADSKVRIFDGFGIVRKFKGLRKTKSHLSASFTSNGRHVVSAGKDSTVYIWNYDFSRKLSARGAKSIRSFEFFFSKGVSVAVPWPSMPQRMSGLKDSSAHPPSPPLKILEPSTWLSNSACFFLGSWLFADGASRVGPAENLPLSAESGGCHLGNYQRELNHHYQQLTSLAAMWSLGIVTASSDGFIRSFHNYGLPVWS